MIAVSSLGWLLLVAATPSASSGAPNHPSRDWYAAATVAEAAIDHIARSDWPGLLPLLTPAAAGDTDALFERAGAIGEVLGKFEYALLADPIAQVSPTCHERRYALAHEQHRASLSLQVCGSGESWAIGHFELVPSLAAQASRLVTHVLAPKLGVKFFPPVCRDAVDTEPSGAFSCWATTRGGETLDLKLHHDETGLSVAGIERAGKAPEATRALLEPLARTALTRIATGQAAALLEHASVQMQDATSPAQLAASLAAFAERPEASPRIEWLGFDPELVAPIVRLKLVRDDGDYEVELRFVPDRGAWRLLRYDLVGGQRRLIRESVMVAQLARELTLDPGARITCPEARANEGPVVCDAVAHGRRITFRKSPVPGKPGRVELVTADLPTILRMRLARLEPMLGWRVTGIACSDETPGLLETTACRVRSPQGDRVLSVVNRGNDLRVIDLHPARPVGTE